MEVEHGRDHHRYHDDDSDSDPHYEIESYGKHKKIRYASSSSSPSPLPPQRRCQASSQVRHTASKPVTHQDLRRDPSEQVAPLSKKVHTASKALLPADKQKSTTVQV